jgi:NitT/TauT family transport system substrate-binding protein
MIRFAAALAFLVAFVTGCLAQEHVAVAAQRVTANGALFLADARGYFKAEGLDVEMTAYASARDIAQAVASGAADFGIAGYTADAFSYAGEGLIKFVAAQVSEKQGFEGNDVVASMVAWTNGLRRVEDLGGNSVAFAGSTGHYQLAELARAKKFDLAGVKLQQMPSEEDVARAVAQQKVHAAILPSGYAHELMIASQAQLIGWYSQIGGLQLGALFASGRMLDARREVAAKFVRAYRRGVADYAGMLQLDRAGKRILSVSTREIATIIARYAYPGKPLGRSAASVEMDAMPIEAGARLDLADLARQVQWYRGQKLIETAADAKDMIDEQLAAGR